MEHFSQDWFNAGTKSQVYTNAPAGMMFPGDTGFPGTSNVFGHKLQFAPRASVVWDPKGDGKMTLRAAYGIFYDTPPLFFFTRFSNNPPWGCQLDLPPGTETKQLKTHLAVCRKSIVRRFGCSYRMAVMDNRGFWITLQSDLQAALGNASS